MQFLSTKIVCVWFLFFFLQILDGILYNVSDKLGGCVMVELVKQDFDKNKAHYKIVEADLVQELGDVVNIDHVGSTAIPDMFGKNIIDVLLGVDDKVQFDSVLQKLVDKGYFASQNSKTDIYQFFASRQGETGDGDVHLHLVIKGTERYNDFLTLRDYLLENPFEAEAYSNHKKVLVSSGVTDRKEYRRIKSEYVSALIDRAREYAENKTKTLE